jgi:flagellar biosynthesis/type III secretory pathway M-ring protein FliF/YscJ
MNLSDISDKQKALILVSGLVALLLIFILSMVSLSNKNNTLTALNLI